MMIEIEDRKYPRRWLPAVEGAPLLGYEKLDAFYRDVREGLLAPHYYERRGKRIFISAFALGLIPSSDSTRPTESQIAGATV